MRTIGRHVPADKPRGDFVAQCDHCGAPWYRSTMRRTGGGLLVCEPCDSGPDATEQLERNAELAEAWGEAQAEIAEPVYDGAPFVFEEPEGDQLDVDVDP